MKRPGFENIVKISRYLTRAGRLLGGPFWRGSVLCVPLILASALWFGTASAEEQRPLLFLCDQNFAPMTYLENGQPKGMVIDILQALGQRIKRRIVARPMEWSKAQDMVMHDAADGLCQISITDGRKLQFDFSAPIMALHFSIFYRVDHKELSDLSDLDGLRAGATPGSLPESLMQQDPLIHVVKINSYRQGLQMIQDNQIDAILVDRWVGDYLLSEQDDPDVRPSNAAAARLQSAIAVKKGNAQLLSLINQGLASLRADGSLDRIYAAWRPKQVVFETREHARRKIYYFLLSALMLLLIGATAWVITMKREVAERIKSEQALKNNRERLTRLSAHIEHIKEQQRVRIAREIHDDLGGNLVAIKMVLHTILHRQPIDTEWLFEKIEYVDTLIDRTIEAGHRIVLELRPGVLDLGIIAAIEWLAREFEKQNNIPCTFSSNSSQIPILPGHATAIFRMAQEALTNISKHANASQVHVTVVSTDNSVNVMIGDNGRGLEKGHENKPNSFGLLGMAERCKEIGGSVWIESNPENGCVVTIRVPL